jgi:hypothetical protein
MKQAARLSTILFAVTVVLAGCAAVRSQDVSVAMTEGSWSVDPVEFADAGTLNVTFNNVGTETHQPIIASTATTLEDLASHVMARGDANLVDELAGADVSGIGAALRYGESGHFHPGGDDAIVPPPHARVDISEDDETTHYLFSSPVNPGTQDTASLSISNFKGDDANTFVVVCMNPDHANRGEYAVFGIPQP